MRVVTVAAERLERWIAGFTERHGETTTTAADDVVELVGADGDRAWVEVPFPPLTGDLVEHVLRPRRIGVLLVRRGGYAAGVFSVYSWLSKSGARVAGSTGTFSSTHPNRRAL